MNLTAKTPQTVHRAGKAQADGGVPRMGVPAIGSQSSSVGPTGGGTTWTPGVESDCSAPGRTLALGEPFVHREMPLPLLPKRAAEVLTQHLRPLPSPARRGGPQEGHFFPLPSAAAEPQSEATAVRSQYQCLALQVDLQ